jgi:Fructose-2,6-bisphosphatase
MNIFYIARHGETVNNRERRLSGWVDSPLTENGLVPTKKVVAKLNEIKFDAIYSSDLGRALSTASEIARELGWNREIQQLSGLREVNYGNVGNKLSKDAYEQYPQLDRDTYFVPPNGESLDQMQKRVFRTIDVINQAHHDANILLVAHSGVMAALRASHVGQDFGEHNISEAYNHDYVGKFTFSNNEVISFEEFTGL